LQRPEIRFDAKGFVVFQSARTITFPESNAEAPDFLGRVDFAKDKVLAEAQFGKYTFMFYDPVKFQYFSNEKKAEVETVPYRTVCERLSTTPSCGERLISDKLISDKMLEDSFPFVSIKDSPALPGCLILCLVLPTDTKTR